MTGSTLRRTPHTVSIVKPTEESDADTNVGKYDYDNPVSTRDVAGLLQLTGGVVTVGSEGQVDNYNAIFYTHDTVVEPNDRMVVALSWLTADFLVLAVQPKTKLRGTFDHTEVILKRDAKR